jgi:hypothetical protein
MLPAFQDRIQLLFPTTSAGYSELMLSGSYRGQIILTVANGTSLTDGDALLGANESITVQYDANHNQAYRALDGNKLKTLPSVALPSYQPIWVDCKEYVITDETNQFLNIELDIGRAYRLKKTATVKAIGLVLIADNLNIGSLNKLD